MKRRKDAISQEDRNTWVEQGYDGLSFIHVFRYCDISIARGFRASTHVERNPELLQWDRDEAVDVDALCLEAQLRRAPGRAVG